MASPLVLPSLQLTDTDKQNKICRRLQGFILDEERQNCVRKVFLDEFALGLASEPCKKSSLLMENTFLPQLLDGTENGEYLALDLGGTNFRVILIKLINGKVSEEFVDYYHIPDERRLGPGKLLFDFLADCIADFVIKRNLQGRHLPLGFTFSFPMIQRSLHEGLLVAWTKSFNCPGVIGNDAVAMLNDAILRRGDIHVDVTAILNDTTGTLVQGAYVDHRCAIGMILGTGSNACYIEKVEQIEKWRGKHAEKEMVIDIEWGAFGDNGVLSFLKTEWDHSVDEKSLIVNSYTFEKYFAGKYLGDLVREVLCTLACEGFFGAGVTEDLKKHGSFTSAHVVAIESDYFKGEVEATRKIILEALSLLPSEDDLHVVQYVCGLISYRGVLLVSILTAILLHKIDREYVTIAIDGSLYENHPRYQPLMKHLISSFCKDVEFELLLAKDGSGKGAALTAAVAERLKQDAAPKP